MLNNRKNDVCYCEECKHKKATECLETFHCKCCLRADQIRIQHPVWDSEENMNEEELEEKDLEEFNEKEHDIEQLGWTGIAPKEVETLNP